MVEMEGIWLGVDVDDTLVKWKGTSYTPMQKNVNSLIRHHKRGHKVIVWSAGGMEWARKVVQELGLEQYVHMVCEKPRWLLDDKDASEWTERYWYSDDGKTSIGVGENQKLLESSEGHASLRASAPGITYSLFTTTTGQGEGPKDSAGS